MASAHLPRGPTTVNVSVACSQSSGAAEAAGDSLRGSAADPDATRGWVAPRQTNEVVRTLVTTGRLARALSMSAYISSSVHSLACNRARRATGALVTPRGTKLVPWPPDSWPRATAATDSTLLKGARDLDGGQEYLRVVQNSADACTEAGCKTGLPAPGPVDQAGGTSSSSLEGSRVTSIGTRWC